MSDNLKNLVLQGVFWKGIDRAGSQFIQFCVSIILARLLYPKDFGLIAIALIFIDLLNRFHDLGFGNAIIKLKHITQEHLSTAFWANFVLGSLLFITAFTAAGPVAAFFANPILKPIIQILATTFIIFPFSMIQTVQLVKKLDFKTNGIINIIGLLFYGGLAVTLALYGFGVWSLAWSSIAKRFFNFLALWMVIPWRPSFVFRMDKLKEMFNFGIFTTLSSLSWELVRKVDVFLISKMIGPAGLGIYDRANALSVYFIRLLTDMVNPVVFPALSKIQDQTDRIKNAYLKNVKFLSMITYPIILGVILVAPELVPVLYGDRWIEAIVPLQFMCIRGFTTIIGTNINNIYQIKHKPQYSFYFHLVEIVVLAGAVLKGLQFGLSGVALAVTLTRIVFFFLQQQVVNRLIGLRWSALLANIFYYLLASIVMAVGLILFRVVNDQFLLLGQKFFLISSIGLGAVLYSVMLWLLDPSGYSELIQIVKQLLPYKPNRTIADESVYTIRIADFPYYSSNPYQCLLSNALNEVKIEVIHGPPFTVEWLRQHRSDVTILHFHWPNYYYQSQTLQRSISGAIKFCSKLIYARWLGYRTIWTAHNLLPHKKQHILVDYIVHFVMARCANSIIVHGQAGVNGIKSRYLRFRNIYIIPHGHYIGCYPNTIGRREARRQLEIPENAFVYLSFGLLRSYKGIEELIKAFHQLPNPNALLMVVGKLMDPQLEIILRKTVATDPRIRLHLEYVPEGNVQLYMNSADVVITPYKRILSSGSVILALSFGKPVIAPRRGDLPEVIQNGMGILYDPNQPGALVQALEKSCIMDLTAASQKTYAKAMSLDWTKIAEQTKSVYIQSAFRSNTGLVE